MKKPVVLIIRDGWGINPQGKNGAESEGDATLLAETPFHDYLYSHYPLATLSGSGWDVGLPKGQMGNSEVGHLNLGAGRIVYQDLTRINQAIEDKKFFHIPVLTQFFSQLRSKQKALHLLGLLSDGGVHSHQKHLYALLHAAKEAKLQEVYIHAFLDGRDTSPTGGINYVDELLAFLEKEGIGHLATIIGRYYAMDRDNRWDRTQKAYELITQGVGKEILHITEEINHCYTQGTTDEFMAPLVIHSMPRPLVKDGDSVLFFNFRSDRARQLSQAFLSKTFDRFPRAYWPQVNYGTMTEYDSTFSCPVLFEPQSMSHIFGEVVSEAGLTQLRMAETEKYPHVTYFFNGGREEPFPVEERVMIPSPKVATYDLKPEMSAIELTEEALKQLRTGKFDVLILNYANPDMVGHTGSLPAAIQAVETIDWAVQQLVETVLELGGKLLITADHGNCEQMIAADGSPHTAHTTNRVHLLYVADDAENFRLKDGILADIAPTLLTMLGLNQPKEMTGHSLLERKG
ncbi:MAG: 2,3-bisphosphoglycerate-independent phosphoglycerate mutase [Verrucomicrobiae bacterium]|nr:2,3-bisphosphoglycerate-independent phosphoglycerate mutase [Verrucomicrobiae bacterium]